jgi:hypothetical protein
MANILYFSNLNPIKFYLPSPDTTYESRHIDDFEFFDSIPEWEEHVDYYQPWNKSDHIFMQLMADFGPHNIKVLNEAGELVTTFQFDQIAQSQDNPTLWIYELDMNLNILDPGVYRFQYEAGADDKLVLLSNQQDICIRHKHSLLLEYQHYQYHEGVVFETGIKLRFRVEGSNKFLSPRFYNRGFRRPNA